VFSFAITSLISLWRIERSQAGLLGTVTLLSSSIGGWIAGILADRYGRAKVLQGTIAWFSVCTLAIGFAQNFAQIFIMRALQGFGFGGEWAVGAVLIAEIVSPQNRGKAVGVVQSGWALGWGAAAILYSVIYSVVREDFAWRCLFWVGALPALWVLYVRKHVTEPAVFVRTRAAEERGLKRPSAWAIFSPSLLPTTLPAALLCTGMQGGYYAMSTWLPTYLKMERHLSVLNTGGYLMVIIVGSFLGYVCGAYLVGSSPQLHHVFSAFDGKHLLIYATPALRCRDAVSWIAARIFFVRSLQRHRCLSVRTLPLREPCQW
jgi:MFS family permease